MEYKTVKEYHNDGYTITVRVPKMTESEKIEADSNLFKKLKSVVQSFPIDKTES